MNYTELNAAIIDYLENQEATFATYIPDFVRHAEKRIHVALKLPNQRKNVTGYTIGGNEYLTIPNDTLKVLSLMIRVSGDWKYLDKKDRTFIREAYTSIPSSAAPVYYAVHDENSLILAPTPDQAYYCHLQVDRIPDSIVDVEQTWMGDNLDRLLLYAALVEGYTFMKGDSDILQIYETAFREELEKASLKVQAGAYGLDEYRAGA